MDAHPLSPPGTIEATKLNKAFNSFKEHSDAHRIATDLAVLESIRQAHPDHHVTYTPKDSCDLLAFAACGFATAELECDEKCFQGIRVYKAHPGLLSDMRHPFLPQLPTESSDRKENYGTLVDHVKFGRFRYRWNDYQFLVYQLEFTDHTFRTHQYFYILTPCSLDDILCGHSASADSLLLAAGRWTTELHEEIYVFDEGFWTKNKDLWKSVQKANWDDVILDPKMKQNLQDDVLGFFDSQKLYEEFSVPWKRGIILHGVPGNGKTITIKALMNSLSSRSNPIPSLYVKSFDGCRGMRYSKSSIQQVFSKARIVAPCLLIFEDLDSLVGDEVRSYFLNEVDGLESNDGVLMIGSTNHLDRLDPAISRRPSRFDRKYNFKVPGFNERVAYCEYWRRKLEKKNNIDFPGEICPFIAALTEGFSFAYLKELFVATLPIVARGQCAEDTESESWEDVQDAAIDTSSTTMKNEEHEKEAYKNDEGGEKVVEEMLKPAKISRPVVTIPKNLEVNPFLKICQKQTKILFDEMDNMQANADPANVGVKEAAFQGHHGRRHRKAH
jgi:transitional endoplasmic reticulum ATPase